MILFNERSCRKSHVALPSRHQTIHVCCSYYFFDRASIFSEISTTSSSLRSSPRDARSILVVISFRWPQLIDSWSHQQSSHRRSCYRLCKFSSMTPLQAFLIFASPSATFANLPWLDELTPYRLSATTSAASTSLPWWRLCKPSSFLKLLQASHLCKHSSLPSLSPTESCSDAIPVSSAYFDVAYRSRGSWNRLLFLGTSSSPDSNPMITTTVTAILWALVNPSTDLVPILPDHGRRPHLCVFFWATVLSTTYIF